MRPDYVVVTSPAANGDVRMDQIRHLYLHYTIEPLVYARANSMSRLTPLLKPVEEAPLEYVYKTDIVALLTECLIKAIEARRNGHRAGEAGQAGRNTRPR